MFFDDESDDESDEYLDPEQHKELSTKAATKYEHIKVRTCDLFLFCYFLLRAACRRCTTPTTSNATHFQHNTPP
jgi:hypothetical protein